MSIKIFFSEISCTSSSAVTDLMELVSHEKKEKLSKFKFDIDRKLSLYGELMVRYQIYKEIGIQNQEIAFIRNNNEKPFL